MILLSMLYKSVDYLILIFIHNFFKQTLLCHQVQRLSAYLVLEASYKFQEEIKLSDATFEKLLLIKANKFNCEFHDTN